MTGKNNTKVCNNKTLLDTCMLMYIVCMLSGSDVLGMYNQIEIRNTIINKIVNAVNGDETLRKNMTRTLKKYGIKTEHGCLCCKKPIPFDDVNVCVKFKDGGPCNQSMWAFLSTFYEVGSRGLELKTSDYNYEANKSLLVAIDDQIGADLKTKD